MGQSTVEDEQVNNGRAQRFGAQISADNASLSTVNAAVWRLMIDVQQQVLRRFNLGMCVYLAARQLPLLSFSKLSSASKVVKGCETERRMLVNF